MSEKTEINPASRRPAVGARRPLNRKRKACPFSGPNAPKIDYKDYMSYTQENIVLSEQIIANNTKAFFELNAGAFGKCGKCNLGLRR